MGVKLIGYSKASKEEIEVLENSLGHKLPEEYIDFLLSYDGAKPATNIFAVGKDNDCGVDRFIPCKDIIRELAHIDHVPKEMIPIAWAEGGNYVIQSVITGKIFFWDHELPDKQVELASVISRFLEQLEPFDADSIELEEGQVDSAWIDPDLLKDR